MDQSTPLPPLETIPQKPQEASQAYVFMGLVVGIVIAAAIIGGLFYKSKLDSIIALNTQTGTKTPTEQQKVTMGTTLLPSITPTGAPAVIHSQQDLTSVQSSLDTTDLTSLSTSLDENAKDAAQFSQ